MIAQGNALGKRPETSRFALKGRDTIAQGNALGKGSERSPFALKGRDTIAQGNALGKGSERSPFALKGRDTALPAAQVIAPLPGSRVPGRLSTQGVALGYRIAPLRGE